MNKNKSNFSQLHDHPKENSKSQLNTIIFQYKSQYRFPVRTMERLNAIETQMTLGTQMLISSLQTNFYASEVNTNNKP